MSLCDCFVIKDMQCILTWKKRKRGRYMAVIPDCLAKLVCLTNQLILSNEQPRAHPRAIFVNENRFVFYYEISSGVGDEWLKVGMDEREKERKKERRRGRKV